MKVRDFCKAFAWQAREGIEPCSMFSADEIIIDSVRINDDSLSLRIHGEKSDLLFHMPDQKSGEKLYAVLRAHLTLDSPLSLQQLGSIDLNL
jgi:hypothetical protein